MKLALGTVQFGLSYGARRPDGPTPPSEVEAILRYAWENGVDMLDVAPAYGRAEEIIAHAAPREASFAIVTKTTRLGEGVGVADVIQSVRRSSEILGVRKLSAVLVHHAPDLLGPDGEQLFQALTALRREGVSERIGVSVYDLETLEQVIERFDIGCVQLPLNILDQRFVQNELLARLAKRHIEVHARSVFLQGRLLMEPDALPVDFAPARARLAALRQEARSIGLSPAAGLIRFVMTSGHVDRLVIGVDSLGDLVENIAAFREASACSSRLDAARYAMADADIIDPRRWTH